MQNHCSFVGCCESGTSAGSTAACRPSPAFSSSASGSVSAKIPNQNRFDTGTRSCARRSDGARTARGELGRKSGKGFYNYSE